MGADKMMYNLCAFLSTCVVASDGIEMTHIIHSDDEKL